MDPRQFEKFVNHWCPENLRHESFENRLVRAFLAATSCVQAYRDRDAGKPVIRPLDLYPNPTYPEGGIGL